MNQNTSVMEDGMQIIRSGIEKCRMQNIEKYGRPYVSWHEQPFEASELLSAPQSSVSGTELEQESQLAVMFHEIIPNPDGSFYGHMYLMGKLNGTMVTAFTFSSDDEVSSMHRHNYVELIYVCEGKMTEIIDGKKYVFTERQVVFMNPNSEHRDIRTESSGICYYLSIRTGLLANFCMQNMEKGVMHTFFLNAAHRKHSSECLVITMNENDAERVNGYLASCFTELQRQEAAYETIVRVMLLRTLNAMSHSAKKESHAGDSSFKMDAQYQRLIRFIDENICDVDVDMLCKHFHYQRNYYNRLIHSHCGKTLSAYIQDLRLQKAMDLLFLSDLSASEICYQVGYKNPTYFHRIFKERTGLTPLEYRERNQ